MHLLYLQLLNSPVSPQNEPIKQILPMLDLLMMIPSEKEVEDVAAIWTSTVGLLYGRKA